MKKASVVSILVFFACLTGCQSRYKGQEIVIEGEGTFPPEAAGVWKTDKGNWEIEFRKDGSIVSAVIPLGRIRMYPGKVKTLTTRFKGKGIFEPGLWQVFYEVESGEMTVILETKHFFQDVGRHSVEGNQKDFLSGRLDIEAGEWYADLDTQGKIEALIYDDWTLIERKVITDFQEPVQRDPLLFIKQP